MSFPKFYREAAAEYQINVYQFIGIGEGRELNRLANLRIRTKYPDVADWYESLDEAGRQSVDNELSEVVCQGEF